ncbi:monocarboxylate transporter 12-like [Venturia canescens]|uniref:monocarboxylate transporter 12-like n=1 Tax=Venturia canescens TaxID=32260 RepID=UPI001C9D2562|nr:monocarboxylate transporter 12-like [Venturia canescens]
MVREGKKTKKEKSVKNQNTKCLNIPTGDFVAPDGGWGWMIVVAAGFSNFCILPIAQSFGLLFRDRFQQLDINSSQITTIMNVNNAATACIGLTNGPLFRRYSYRQVSFVGALVSAVSICALSFATTFQSVLIFYSILYGCGMGIAMSSCALALNTYFKKRRRIATGFSWTCTGLGPIIMPQIITLLMPIYGMSGTVLLYGGFAFNAVACALLLQPVELHVKKGEACQAAKVPEQDEKVKEKLIEANGVLKIDGALSVENILRQQDKLGNFVDNRLSQRFGSQYLYYNDDEDGAAGIDVLASGTPMMSRANDGWFSKKNASSVSLASSRTPRKDASQTTSRRPSISLSRGNSARNLSSQNSDADFWKRKISTNVVPPLIIVNESEEQNSKSTVSPREKENGGDETESRLLAGHEVPTEKEIVEDEINKSVVWYRRAFYAVIVFFDLDLLRDPIYVNLMLGITFANFAELNFALLTPFILGEYGFAKIEVATVMSVLAGVDVLMRIIIPFVATRIGWQNRTFFLIGVGSMAAGRIILAHVRTYGVLIAVAVLIGAGKALRTIFMALVIPTHVPLERLPAASGLHLLISGLIYLILGPIVGWIRDLSGSYTVTLHCLNLLTYMTIISWTLEVWYCARRSKRLERKSVAPI